MFCEVLDCMVTVVVAHSSRPVLSSFVFYFPHATVSFRTEQSLYSQRVCFACFPVISIGIKADSGSGMSMDKHAQAMNMSDEEIVKETQFPQDEIRGSQISCTAEPVFANGFVESRGYNDWQGSRCQPVSHVPYPSQSAWTNSAPFYGSYPIPIQHVFGNGFYPPFTPMNYSQMYAMYGVPSFVPHVDRLNPIVAIKFGEFDSNAASPHMRNMNHPSQEMLMRPSFVAPRQVSAEELHMSAKTGCNSGFSEPSQTLQRNDMDGTAVASTQTMNDKHDVLGNNIIRKPRSTANPVSDPRQSSATNSADNTLGPVMDDSVESYLNIPETQNPKSTPLKKSMGLQRDSNDSSKSSTPYCIVNRKAVRGDEKSYMEEVKLAISEGRVPQVKVHQDEKGNILRYKSQFFNALKIAGHAIVQDTYINVNEHETMNEIMKEVLRQFILPKPLPAGTVESYLKGCFKRRRSEYHQFWLKHGDTKKPDNCKKAAWLQLVEFWKSPDGMKECNRNKVNASAPRGNSVTGKHQAAVRSISEHGSPDKEVLASPAYKQKVDTSLSERDCLGLAESTPSPHDGTLYTRTARNAMEDISNKLHSAVDNILSSFASTCNSQNSFKSWDTKATIDAYASQNSKPTKPVSRTAAQVLCSLKRPEEGQSLHLPQNYCTHPRGAHTETAKCTDNNPMRSSNHGRREMQPKLQVKGSGNDSMCRGRALFSDISPKGIVDPSSDRNERPSASLPKKVHVLLSSNSSSDDELQRQRIIRSEKALRSTSVASMQEREVLPDSAATAHEPKIPELIAKKRCLQAKNNNQPLPSEFFPSASQKVVNENKDTVGIQVREELKNGNSTEYLRTSNGKSNAEGNSDSETRSEDNSEEDVDGPQDLDEENDDEEAPILPRQIVKRKLQDEDDGSIARKQQNGKSNNRTMTPSKKRTKGNQMDSAFIKKLELYKRPKNSNPIKNRVRIWVLHPKYVGKVVAEGYAGVNRKSKCLGSANEACKEGQQMIFVNRVFYKNTPVMYDAQCRYPRNVHYLDQVEVMPNLPILWCVCHVIEIPPLDQVSRFLAEARDPESQASPNTDLDFERNRLNKISTSKDIAMKEKRRGRSFSNGLTTERSGRGSRKGRRQ